MRLITSFLILWPCWGLTMEEPQPTPYLYSDVDACTRYNFLPINAKNFREAILFFNLCTQLLRLLPEDQQKDYARHLKHEIIMTRNEFKSKNGDGNEAEWLDSKTDLLLRELNKKQSKIRDRNDFKIGLSWPLLPLGRINFRKKSDAKAESRYKSDRRIPVDESDQVPRQPDYNQLDQESDSVPEEKISVNDLAMIGLILGLVSTVSGALTLLYIFYCGTKGAKKKVITDSHQKGGADDKEKLTEQRLSRSAMESQMSTKIAKYASGECKLNESNGRLSQSRSLDANRATKNEEQTYENPCRDELNMVSEYGADTYEPMPSHNQANENLVWNTTPFQETTTATYPLYIDDTQVSHTPTTAYHSGEFGYPANNQQFSQSVTREPNQLEFYTLPTNELTQRPTSKEGYGDELKNVSNDFSQQKIGFGSMPVAMKETASHSSTGVEKKQSLPFSYIHQRYTKSHVPLMNSHFPCEVRQQQSPQKFQLQQTTSQVQPTQEKQQTQLQDFKMTRDTENNEAMISTYGENGQSQMCDSDISRMEERIVTSECKNCKKRMPLVKKRQGLTCENMSALVRMRMEASKNDSGISKPCKPAPCNMTDSENIMRQEKFLCSLSATSPLTTKEPNILTDNQEMDKPQTQDGNGAVSEKNKGLPAKGDTSNDIQNHTKKNMLTSHTTPVKKYPKTKCRQFRTILGAQLSKKNPHNLPVEKIDSSYYSMKRNSPYQSCAEVSPLQTSKVDCREGDETENAFSLKSRQNDPRKPLMTMFCRNT